MDRHEPRAWLLVRQRSVRSGQDLQGHEVLMLPDGMELGDPWTPFVHDIWVYNAFVQEDCSEGPVSSWPNRGARFSNPAGHAIQANAEERPKKLTGASGVEFSSGSHLSWPSDKARWVGVRGTLTVFRIDWSSVSGSCGVVVPQFSKGNTASDKSSALYAHKAGNAVIAQWRDPRGDNSLFHYGLGASYSDWIVALHFHRDGKLFCKVNGGDARDHGYDTFQPDRAPDGSAMPSYFGLPGNIGTFALDCRIEFAGEPSDEWLAKLEKWAANRVGVTLPAEHRFFSSDPVVTLSDFPHSIDMFNEPQWTTDIQQSNLDTANRGKPLPSDVVAAFDTPIFLDDFREKSVAPGNRLEKSIWFSIGGLAGNTVGVHAALVHTNQSPDCYPYDRVAKTLGVRAQTDASGNKRTGAASTVDRLDNGITFKGGFHLRYRFKLKIPVQRNYYFPACPWFYGNKRSKNGFGVAREIDTIEIDTADTSYMNNLSYHAHEAAIRAGLNGRAIDDLPSRKFMAGHMTIANGYASNIDFGDGGWHTYDYIIDDDAEVIYSAIDNQEVGRFRRPFVHNSRYHMIVNNAIRSGPWFDSEYCELIFEQIIIKKKSRHVAAVPAPFIGRPTLGGNFYVGGLISVDPQLPPSIKQFRVEWYFEDGYPIVREKSGILAILPEYAGKRITAKVVALGHEEIDEAWSQLTVPIGSGVASLKTADFNFAAGTYMANGMSYASFSSVREALPYLGFQRDTPASILTAQKIVPDVPKHMPRIDTRGLIYQPPNAYSGVSIAPPGPSGGAWAREYAEYEALGGKKASTFFEDPTTSVKRLASLPCGSSVAGHRHSALFVVRKGSKRLNPTTHIRVEGFYKGAGNTHYNLSTGVVQSERGVTASMEPLGSDPNWWICYWSKIDNIGVSNAAIAMYSAVGLSDSGRAIIGQPDVPSCHIALTNHQIDTTVEKIVLPQWFVGHQSGDRLFLPLGAQTKNITLQTAHPLTGETASQTFTNEIGDYSIDPYILTYPIIKRLEIT